MNDNTETQTTVGELQVKREAAWNDFKAAQLDLFSWSVVIAENTAAGQPTHPETLKSWRAAKTGYDLARAHHGALCAEIRKGQK